MVNPLRLQEINLPRVLERVNDWKIPDTEKENIRKFAHYQRGNKLNGTKSL
jgi:hypothetical protein